MNNKTIVISNKVPQICNFLKELGYKLIYTDCVDGFISYEQNHADMQCLSIDAKVFVLSECTSLYEQFLKYSLDIVTTSNPVAGKYPNNIVLNAQIVGKYIIGKIKSLDESLVKYCVENEYEFINVNQGYAACSCLKVDDNSIITADNSIYNALKNTDIDVLKIEEGHIKLDCCKREEVGFIGGASVTLGKQILFFGDIKKHPSYQKIKNFCDKKSVEILTIEDLELTDIGGAILLNN